MTTTFASTTHSATVRCGYSLSPCGGRCGGEVVTATGTIAGDTVEISACSYLLAQGWKGAASVLWKAQAGLLEWLV